MRKQMAIVGWVLCLVLGALNAQTHRSLVILHTNDMHSRVEPFPEDYPDTLWAGKGGLARRAVFVRQQRELFPDLLLFDAGDFSQGTPYYNVFKGEVEVKMMNVMGYDAATIGNHEFDFGLENMARLFRLAEFPVVCANYAVAGTGLEGLVKEYVVLQRQGVRIGVFGLGPELEGLVQREKYAGIRYLDPVAEGQRVATLLREREHCDVVVCLSHLGWKGTSCPDVEWIARTRGIDLVIGGHTHSLFTHPEVVRNLDGEEVPVQQMGKNAAFIGKLVMQLQKE